MLAYDIPVDLNRAGAPERATRRPRTEPCPMLARTPKSPAARSCQAWRMLANRAGNIACNGSASIHPVRASCASCIWKSFVRLANCAQSSKTRHLHGKPPSYSRAS